jgi:hypothetical protein
MLRDELRFAINKLYYKRQSFAMSVLKLYYRTIISEALEPYHLDKEAKEDIKNYVTERLLDFDTEI